MRKFREIEQLERDQLARRQRERIEQFFLRDRRDRHIHNRTDYHEPPLEDFYLKEISYKRSFDDRENNFNYSNTNENNRKINDWRIDDEAEDDLYFNHGRKSRVSTNEDIDQDTTISSVSVVKDDDAVIEEYDPKDYFESASSAWSSSEDEAVEYLKKSKRAPKLALNPKKGVVSSLAAKPKAYAPKFVDIDAPTVIKLPPNPIPSTWAHLVHNPLKQGDSPKCREICTDSIQSEVWLEGLELSNSVQGIYMKPPFSDTFTIPVWAQFMKRLLPVVMEDGYLFIWVQREELAGVIREADRLLSFKYVENLCWVRRDLGNKLMKEPLALQDQSHPALFYKSKLTLLILRRDPNNTCTLRHQRNPDCIFDFVGPGRMPDGRAYDVIETLLDGSKSHGPHLMHLWAGSSPTDRLVYQSRKHWIRVVEDVTEEQAYSQDAIEAAVGPALSSPVSIASESVQDDTATIKPEPVNEHCTDHEPELETNANNDKVLDLAPESLDSINNEIISPESENDLNDLNDLKSIELSSSAFVAIPSSFTEDFNNFITSEPINNYQWS